MIQKPRKLLVLLAFCGMFANAGIVHADCFGKSGEPLKLIKWNALKSNDATTTFQITLESKLAKPARMLDGYVQFEDALGDNMGAFRLPRDKQYSVGTSIELSLQIGALVVPRVLEVNKEDVLADACVKSVIYEDGTKEVFE